MDCKKFKKLIVIHKKNGHISIKTYNRPSDCSRAGIERFLFLNGFNIESVEYYFGNSVSVHL